MLNMKLLFPSLLIAFSLSLVLPVQAQTNANAGFTSPPQYQPFLKQLADDVSADQIEYYTRSLAAFENRHTLSDTTSDTKGIGAARRWIKEEFEKISEKCGDCLEVFYVNGTVGGENRIP